MEEKKPIGLKKVASPAVINLQQGKIPPQALDLEEAVLGAMLIDPKSGKVYDCYLSLEDSKTLKVRGFLGFSLLGRTQIWKRQE